MYRKVLPGFAMLFLFSTASLAQITVGENGEFSGLFFGDYYWIAQDHNEDIEGRNGFWIRRIYLTYEHQLSESFSSRIRLEANTPGDFDTDASMVPDIKDAYLKWSDGNHQILAGISSTPTINIADNIWGYRSLVKSPLDLYNFGSSRDFGIALKGKFRKSGKLGYHFFLGNGNGNSAEINKGKKLMLSLNYDLSDHFIVEAYGDWNSDLDGGNAYTGQSFAAYHTENVTIGGLYAYQFRERSAMARALKLDLVSIFTNISVNNNVKAILRADHLFDSYINGASNAYLPFSVGVESTFLIGGADIQLEENIHLIPNIEAIIYGEDTDGDSPKTDIVPRLTLSFTF